MNATTSNGDQPMPTASKQTTAISTKAVTAFLNDPDLALLAFQSLSIGRKAVAP